MTATDIHGCHVARAELQPPAPADDERGEGDERHGLRDDRRSGSSAPLGDAEALHQHGQQPSPTTTPQHEARRAAIRNVYQAPAATAGGHGAVARPRCSGSPSRSTMSHTCGIARSSACSGSSPAEHAAAVRRPCSPPSSAPHERRRAPSTASRRRRTALTHRSGRSTLDAAPGTSRCGQVVAATARPRRDDRLAVGARASRPCRRAGGRRRTGRRRGPRSSSQPRDVRARPGRGGRTGRRSRRARSRRGCCRPGRARCSRSPGGPRCSR